MLVPECLWLKVDLLLPVVEIRIFALSTSYKERVASLLMILQGILVVLSNKPIIHKRVRTHTRYIVPGHNNISSKIVLLLFLIYQSPRGLNI